MIPTDLNARMAAATLSYCDLIRRRASTARVVREEQTKDASK